MAQSSKVSAAAVVLFVLATLAACGGRPDAVSPSKSDRNGAEPPPFACEAPSVSQGEYPAGWKGYPTIEEAGETWSSDLASSRFWTFPTAQDQNAGWQTFGLGDDGAVRAYVADGQVYLSAKIGPVGADGSGWGVSAAFICSDRLTDVGIT